MYDVLHKQNQLAYKLTKTQQPQVHQLTSSSTHKLINSQTHQLTDYCFYFTTPL